MDFVKYERDSQFSNCSLIVVFQNDDNKTVCFKDKLRTKGTDLDAKERQLKDATLLEQLWVNEICTGTQWSMKSVVLFLEIKGVIFQESPFNAETFKN